MKPCNSIQCERFPCADVMYECFVAPNINLKPNSVSVVMIAEAAPANSADYFYAKGEPLFAQTTLLAFNDAGANVQSVNLISALGVDPTTAVKWARRAIVSALALLKNVRACSNKNLLLFPNVRAFLLMGDVAIKGVNYIAKRAGRAARDSGGIDLQDSRWQICVSRRARVSIGTASLVFFVEKSKRKMIAQDIASALKLIR